MHFHLSISHNEASLSSGFDQPLLYRLNREARGKEVVSYIDGNSRQWECEGYNECYGANTKVTNDGSEN